MRTEWKCIIAATFAAGLSAGVMHKPIVEREYAAYAKLIKETGLNLE